MKAMRGGESGKKECGYALFCQTVKDCCFDILVIAFYYSDISV